MNTLAIIANLILLLLVTLRGTRFLVTDDLGKKLTSFIPGKFAKDLFSCIYCTSFWVATFAVLSWYLFYILNWLTLWQLLALPFALSWLAAHIGERVGDAGWLDYDDDDDNNAVE